MWRLSVMGRYSFLLASFIVSLVHNLLIFCLLPSFLCLVHLNLLSNYSCYIFVFSFNMFIYLFFPLFSCNFSAFYPFFTTAFIFFYSSLFPSFLPCSCLPCHFIPPPPQQTQGTSVFRPSPHGSLESVQ